MKAAIRRTTLATSSIFFLSIGAVMFTRFMGLPGVPRALTDAMLAVSENQIVIILMVAALVVILGMVIDSIGLLLLTLPVLLPVLEAADINLIWFGIICIKLLEIRLVTPPVGLNLYVLHTALSGEVKLRDTISGTTWFIAVDLLTQLILMILIAFPAISLFLPSLMAR